MREINSTPYEYIGPENLKKLVDVFYDRVKKDSTLSPLFTGDINITKKKQEMFLTQFLGGPSLYSDEYGHPRLRMRHMPFPITVKHSAAWLNCMKLSLQEIDIPDDLREFLYERLTITAEHMVNTPSEDEDNE